MHCPLGKKSVMPTYLLHERKGCSWRRQASIHSELLPILRSCPETSEWKTAIVFSPARSASKFPSLLNSSPIDQFDHTSLFQKSSVALPLERFGARLPNHASGTFQLDILYARPVPLSKTRPQSPTLQTGSRSLLRYFARYFAPSALTRMTWMRPHPAVLASLRPSSTRM